LILFSYKGGGFFTNKSNIFELQGIVSVALTDPNNEAACDPKEYAIFTNVSPFIEWIREKMEEEWTFTEMECRFNET